MAEITFHLDVLNLTLQGKGHSVLHLVEHVEGFSSKTVLFQYNLRSIDLTHLLCCSVIEDDNPNAKLR